jgi:hypothetical protein
METQNPPRRKSDSNGENLGKETDGTKPKRPPKRHRFKKPDPPLTHPWKKGGVRPKKVGPGEDGEGRAKAGRWTHPVRSVASPWSLQRG